MKALTRDSSGLSDPLSRMPIAGVSLPCGEALGREWCSPPGTGFFAVGSGPG